MISCSKETCTSYVAGEPCEIFHCVLESKSFLEKMTVIEHTLPFFLPLRELESDLLSSNAIVSFRRYTCLFHIYYMQGSICLYTYSFLSRNLLIILKKFYKLILTGESRLVSISRSFHLVFVFQLKPSLKLCAYIGDKFYKLLICLQYLKL